MKKSYFAFILIFLFALIPAVSCKNSVKENTDSEKKELYENTIETESANSDKLMEEQEKETKTEITEEQKAEIETEENEEKPEFSPDPKYGKEIFNNTCASCHGTSGSGDGVAAEGLNPRPTNLQDAEYISGISDKRMFKTINEGGAAVGRSALMPPWKGILTEQQIRDVISHIRTNLCKCSPLQESEDNGK